MGRNKQKHKREKKRRHERQIAEGTRQAKPKTKKRTHWGAPRRVKLSELNREDVQKILRLVEGLKMYS